jgi:hypothetical protein
VLKHLFIEMQFRRGKTCDAFDVLRELFVGRQIEIKDFANHSF